jgi:hypothetical protein
MSALLRLAFFILAQLSIALRWSERERSAAADGRFGAEGLLKRQE